MYKFAKPVVVDDELLRQAMQELAGEASMAWDPHPSFQVFDSRAALRAVDGALGRLSPKEALNKTALAAFADELEGIAKEGAFLTNVSAPIKSAIGKASTRAANWARGRAAETGLAFQDHLHPIDRMRESWKGSRWWGMKGLTVAGAGLEAADALHKEDPEGKGRGRGERIGRAAAGTATGLITMKRGLIPSLVSGAAAGYAGGKAGKLFDRKKKLPKQPDQAPPPQVQQTAE